MFRDTVGHIIEHGHMGIFPGYQPLVVTQNARWNFFPSGWNGVHGVFTFQWEESNQHPYPNATFKVNDIEKVMAEHKNKVAALNSSVQGFGNAGKWTEASLKQANASTISSSPIWQRFVPSRDNGIASANNRNRPRLWGAATRCLAEILTGLIYTARVNNSHQIIQVRPIQQQAAPQAAQQAAPPAAQQVAQQAAVRAAAVRAAAVAAAAGQIIIKNTGESINIVIPIGGNIGSGTAAIPGGIVDSLPADALPVQYIEMFVKIKNGKVTIASIFPCNFDEYANNNKVLNNAINNLIVNNLNLGQIAFK
jgi:hypothetical protein